MERGWQVAELVTHSQLFESPVIPEYRYALTIYPRFEPRQALKEGDLAVRTGAPYVSIASKEPYASRGWNGLAPLS